MWHYYKWSVVINLSSLCWWSVIWTHSKAGIFSVTSFLWAITLVLQMRHQLPWAAGDAGFERGVNVDHSTIYRWVQRYAPEMENGCACGTGVTLFRSLPVAHGWNHVKVNGRWAYLYRAVDSRGPHCRFLSLPCRNSKAAYRFLGKIRQQREEVRRSTIHQHGIKCPAGSRLLCLKRRPVPVWRWTPTKIGHPEQRDWMRSWQTGKRIINATLGFKIHEDGGDAANLLI